MSRWVFVLIYLALAAVQLQPVNPLLQIPAGTESSATVPFFNLWTVAHNTDFITGDAGYWEACFFHPEESTFVLSESQPLLMLMAPIARVVSPTFAYNVWVFVNLSLNGASGYWFARRNWGAGPASAIFCGVMLQLLPFVNMQLGVLQLISVWPFVLLLHFTRRLTADGKLSTAFFAGGMLGVSYLSCNNYGLMQGILLAFVFGPVILCRFPAFQCLRIIAVACVCFLLVAGPIIARQLSVLGMNQYRRDSATVAGLSIQLADLAVNPWNNRLSIPGLVSVKPRPLWGMSCGFGNYLLAAGGIVAGLRTKKFRAWTITLTGFTILSVFLAAIPGAGSLGVSLHKAMCSVIPGLSQVRSVYRFVLIFQVGVVFLACVFISERRSLLNQMMPSREFTRKVLNVVILFLALGSIIEVFPDPTYVCTPLWQIDQPFCRWIRENTEPHSALACFPFPAGREAHDYTHEVDWMFAARQHQRPIINGYSGFFPKNYVRIKEQATFPLSTDLVNLFKGSGVEYVLVKEDWLFESQAKRYLPQNDQSLEERFFDPLNAVRIFRLK